MVERAGKTGHELEDNSGRSGRGPLQGAHAAEVLTAVDWAVIAAFAALVEDDVTRDPRPAAEAIVKVDPGAGA